MTEKKPHPSKTGAWVITNGTTTIIENSEIRALRKAVDIGGSVYFVKWGDSFAQAQNAPASERETEPIEDSTY